ncbi:MAG: amidohydrolase family protein [Nakamurella sp.]
MTTNDPAAGPGLLGIVPKASIIIQDGLVAWVGPTGSAPSADTATDLGGRAVIPGWVDSQTQLICPVDQVDEFAAGMRRHGDVAVRMQRTLDATRAAADPDLLAAARWRRSEMLGGGTTCAATATGYGLTVRDEARAAMTAQTAGFDDISFFGANVVPPEYGRDPDGYLDLVCGPMLDAVAPLVGWIDVACAGGAFDSARARRVLAAGQRKGLGLRVHGDPFGSGPAALVAVDTGAASVDVSSHLTDQDVTALAGSDTAATVLPLRELANGQPPVPGRRLLDAGVRIAVASGCNPETSYSPSMNLAVALAVLQCGLTPAEAVHAGTVGGARALHRTDVGALTVGARADLHVLNAPSFEYLAYRPGLQLTQSVYRRGTRVARSGDLPDLAGPERRGQ